MKDKLNYLLKIAKELRRACSKFLRTPATPETCYTVTSFIQRTLMDACQGGLLRDHRDVQFDVKIDVFDHSKVTIQPRDFYSALAIQFLAYGIPGCSALPPKKLIGEDQWKDSTGGIWKLSGGILYYCPAKPLDYIRCEFITQAEDTPNGAKHE